MDSVSSQLHSLLVRMGFRPEAVAPETEHLIEHLLTLLPPDDQEALTHYYGLFGEEQLSLQDIARRRNQTPEHAMDDIDRAVRQLAVSPEWQMMKHQTT